MRKILLFLLLILALPLVMANAEVDVNVKCIDDDCRVNQPIYMIYNITLSTNECCGGLGLEHENGTRYFCAFEDTGGTEYINQICSLTMNETGQYKVFKGENLEISYLNVIKVRNALPDGWSVALLALFIAFILIAWIIHPIFYLMAILTLIGAITSLIFTYSYILSPILIGVVSIIYIGLLVLVYEIFKQLF